MKKYYILLKFVFIIFASTTHAEFRNFGAIKDLMHNGNFILTPQFVISYNKINLIEVNLNGKNELYQIDDYEKEIKFSPKQIPIKEYIPRYRTTNYKKLVGKGAYLACIDSKNNISFMKSTINSVNRLEDKYEVNLKAQDNLNLMSTQYDRIYLFIIENRLFFIVGYLTAVDKLKMHGTLFNQELNKKLDSFLSGNQVATQVNSNNNNSKNNNQTNGTQNNQQDKDY